MSDTRPMRDGWEACAQHEDADARGILSSSRYVSGLRLGATYAPWMRGWVAEVDDNIGPDTPADTTAFEDEQSAQLAAECVLRAILSDALKELAEA